ncbi:hypothetical protein [Propionibacterium freudenreichii]|uniref:hypothetical protein n=1 Tax=Propionibacterium freudenreichii TaxID=1744 RepID=UPI00288BD9E3|nr:hypothetical protein [Propionibacterium freudenreichii]
MLVVVVAVQRVAVAVVQVVDVVTMLEGLVAAARAGWCSAMVCSAGVSGSEPCSS